MVGQHEQLKKNFDEAKQISDFVGFIIRWSFILLTLNFVLARVFSDVGIFEKLSLGIFGLWAFALLLYFSIKIFAVIFHYNTRRMDNMRISKLVKIQAFMCACGEALLVFSGAFFLVREIAKSSTLLAR